jgi:hypothetical protein
MVTSDNLVSLPSRPSSIYPSKVNPTLTDEFVVVNGYSNGINKVLSPIYDDVEFEVSLKQYDRMENDSSIAKCKKILITSVLSDETQLSPGATEAEVGEKEYDTFVQVMDFCNRVINGMDRDIRSSLEQVYGNAIKHGHGIGEIEWEHRKDAPSTKPPEPSQKQTKIGTMFARVGAWFKGPTMASSDTITRPVLKGEVLRLMPRAIKVKPRGSALFVVDDFMNVLGLVPARRVVNGKLKWDEIISREKFMVLTLNKCDEDPRGKSSYRPAFNWYNLKTQLPTEMLRFILEEAVPKAIGVLPPNSIGYEIERDSQGNTIFEEDGKTPKMLTLADSFKKIIENFRSGAGAVIPHESELKPFKQGITGANDAQIFAVIIKIINDEIENAILLQTLAQSEGAHQARSAAQQVALVLYNLVFWTRWAICEMIMNDLLIPAVKYNLGEWALRYLPQISLGDFVRRDWDADLAVLADAYFKGLLDDSQRPALMAWMNLPTPGESRQEQTMAQMDTAGNAVPPPRNRPDKQAGNQNRNTGNGTEKKTNAKSNTDTRFGPLDMLGHHRGWPTRFKRNI